MKNNYWEFISKTTPPYPRPLPQEARANPLLRGCRGVCPPKSEGKKRLEHTMAEHPQFWNERKWKCPKSPVVGICWYEAKAFTNWLTSTDKDGYQYRMPDENEWEAAAAGFEGREYPWGNQWDKNKCNTYEGRVRKNSPVGIFNKGNTPEGISDLAGNVWEWTSSDYYSKNLLKDFKFDN